VLLSWRSPRECCGMWCRTAARLAGRHPPGVSQAKCQELSEQRSTPGGSRLLASPFRRTETTIASRKALSRLASHLAANDHLSRMREDDQTGENVLSHTSLIGGAQG
jgi:hypothetical protein